MKNTILALFLIICSFAFGQEKTIEKFYYPESKYPALNQDDEMSRKNLKAAYDAFNAKEPKDQIKYYLFESVTGGVYSSAYFYLYGMWAYDYVSKKEAQKIWKRGAKHSNCWECEELYVAIKFDKDITEVILKQQAKWEAENK